MNFDEWFSSMQGVPYYGMYDFAKDACNAAKRTEREECAKIADEAKLNAARIGAMHEEDSASRDRMFARSIEAGYIADEIRSKQ